MEPCARLGPHLGTQQAEAALHKAVPEMSQHYIIASEGDGVVEGDRAAVPAMRVFEADNVLLPGAFEVWDLEYRARGSARKPDWRQRRLPSQSQRDLHR